MKIFLVEIETLEPVVIAAKKGRSKLVEGLRYIPASSIAGAIARKTIIENMKASLGNCKDVSLDRTPDCSNCPKNCPYKRLWIDKKAKITNAVKGSWDLRSPGIVNLQSVCEPRIKDSNKASKRDYLFKLFLERMTWSGEANPRDASAILEMDYKKSPSNFDGTDFSDVELVQLTRVSIDERLKTCKEGLLYSFTAIKDGQKFRFMALVDEDFKEILNGEMRIGAWRSRGMGLVRSRVVEEISKEEYIQFREKEIRKGFDEIAKVLDGSGLEGYYGTYTYLTDGTKKLDLDTRFRVERIRRLTRYEKDGQRASFISRNTIMAGSAGVFYTREPENLSRSLAELELGIFGDPWFDWVFFNHPVHYEKSVLRG